MEQKTIQIPVPEFNDHIHKWQHNILQKFDDRLYRFFLLCWHRRARKTTLLLNILIKEACRNPKSVYWYIAPTYRQAKDIIWRDPNMLNRYLPDYIKRKNESELFIEFNNNSILKIKGADDPDSLRGPDWQGVGLDEWALMKSDTWDILSPVARQNPNRWAIFTFTPKGRNHAFDYWLKAEEWKEWYKSFLPVSESKLLLKDELDQEQKEKPHSFYMQEYECSFLAATEQILILPEDIEALKTINRIEPQVKRIIACDPSQGGDECAIYILENSRIVYEEFLHYHDSMKIAGELMILSNKFKINDIAIDSIGSGWGIMGRLRELGKHVIEINSSEKAAEEERFYNARAEMWWHLMQRIVDQNLVYPVDLELRRQLSSIKYKVVNSNGKIQLDSKLETKKELGRSPDRGDAFVYGIWAQRYVKEYKPKKKDWLGEYRKPSLKQVSHMAA